jgi:phosphinothricin acetyltransferase
MTIRVARADDAAAIAAIYAPIVRDTVISFETEPPSAAEMRERMAAVLARLPWLVSEDAAGQVDGYAYAGRHRDKAAYQWSVDTTIYLREDARDRGLGKRLYVALFERLAGLGYYRAFAGIALPNAASVALHESVGFTTIGVYRQVGFKFGAWRDVGWWQRSLREPEAPSPTLPFPGP